MICVNRLVLKRPALAGFDPTRNKRIRLGVGRAVASPESADGDTRMGEDAQVFQGKEKGLDPCRIHCCDAQSFCAHCRTDEIHVTLCFFQNVSAGVRLIVFSVRMPCSKPSPFWMRLGWNDSSARGITAWMSCFFSHPTRSRRFSLYRFQSCFGQV